MTINFVAESVLEAGPHHPPSKTKKLHQHRPQTVLNCMRTCPFHRQKIDVMENAKSACNMHPQRPRERRLGAARRYTKTPHGRALYKDTDTGRRKQKTNHRGKTKDRMQMRGEETQEHCRLKVTRRTVGKGAATKTSTKADNN